MRVAYQALLWGLFFARAFYAPVGAQELQKERIKKEWKKKVTKTIGTMILLTSFGVMVPFSKATAVTRLLQGQALSLQGPLQEPRFCCFCLQSTK